MCLDTHCKVIEREIEVCQCVREREQIWQLRDEMSFEVQFCASIHHALDDSYFTWVNQRLVTGICKKQVRPTSLLRDNLRWSLVILYQMVSRSALGHKRSEIQYF